MESIIHHFLSCQYRDCWLNLMIDKLPRPLPYLMPLAAYMFAATWEPDAENFDLQRYAMVYIAKVVITVALLGAAFPVMRQLSWKISPLAFVVGLAGGVVWVLLSSLHIEWWVLEQLGRGQWIDGIRRPELDPFAEDTGLAKWLLATRLFGLVLVVPLAEELFLRGFLLRFFTDEKWWQLPVGALSRTAMFAGTAYGILAHPSEVIAAALWFSAVTWLSIRTKSFGACVVAHALTNLVLGVYVLTFQDWTLW